MIVLQAERLAIDLVQDRQCHVQILHAPFHVFDTRVDFRTFHLQLLEVFLNVPLLHPILILDIVREILSDTFESQLVLLLTIKIDACAVLAQSGLCLDRPHTQARHHLPLNDGHLHLVVDFITELDLFHILLNFFFQSVSKVVCCRILGLSPFHELSGLREVIHILLHAAPFHTLIFLSLKVVDGQNTRHKCRLI